MQDANREKQGCRRPFVALGLTPLMSIEHLLPHDLHHEYCGYEPLRADCPRQFTLHSRSHDEH